MLCQNATIVWTTVKLACWGILIWQTIPFLCATQLSGLLQPPHSTAKDTTHWEQTRKSPGRSRTEEALWYSLYGQWFCQEKPLLYWRQSELSKGREANGQSLASDCANQASESTPKQRYPCWMKKTGQVDSNWNNGNHTSLQLLKLPSN